MTTFPLNYGNIIEQVRLYFLKMEGVSISLWLFDITQG